MYKPIFEPFHLDEAIRAFHDLGTAVREKATERNDAGLIRLLKMEYILTLERLIEQFGVYEEMRKRIVNLRSSRKDEDIRLCYLLCKVTGSGFFLPTLNRNPEHARLERAGMLAAAKEGKLGAWFKEYVYPPQ